MNLSLQEILGLPDEERRKLKIRRIRRKVVRQVRRQTSPGEMLKILRDRSVRSSRKWMKVRFPSDPTIYDFRKEFGSWRKAVKLAFREVDSRIEMDAEYLVKLVIQFDLWTYDKYISVHKAQPEIVPSYEYLRKRWESYKSLVEFARRSALKSVVDRYFSLYRRLGKKPTMEQCRVDGVQLDEAIRLLGGRNNLNELIVMMEQLYEKQRRSV